MSINFLGARPLSYSFVATAWVTGLFVSSAGHAQDAGALQRELQLQLQRSAPQAPVQPQKPVAPTPPKPDEQKQEVKGYNFQGNTLLTNEQLQEAVKQWANTQIRFSELQDVTAALRNLYAKNGRVAQANIPPQEIQDGVILINIVEGKLGAVIVEPSQEGQALRTQPDHVQGYFKRSDEGKEYIDTRPLNRSLLLINELPGVKATGGFEAGSTAGESNFRVKLDDGPLFAGQASISNAGSASTGVTQVLANLSVNNPLGYGDQVTIDAIQTLGSLYGQLGYSFPVGHDGWRLGVQANALTYETLADWSATQSQGIADTVGMNASYALLREPGNTMNARFKIENRGYSNSQAHANISNYQITAYSAALDGSFADTTQSLISYSLTGVLGNLVMNNAAQAAQDAAGPGTAGIYKKLSFTLSRTETLAWLPSTTWLMSLNGQIASANLNSSEQTYLGGSYAVRAYPGGQGGGSQGGIFTNELQHRLNENWQLGAFLDVGLVQQYVNLYDSWQGLTNAGNVYFLAAMGPIVKFEYEKLQVSATLALRLGNNPLYNSSGEQLNADNAYKMVQAWVKASYAF